MAIAFDSQDGVCRVGSPIAFSGYVDDFETGVAAIELSLDNGATWTSYPTTGAVTERGVNWLFSYTPEMAGTYLLKARAIDNNNVPSPLVSSFAFEVFPPADPDLVETYGGFNVRAIDGGPLKGAKLFRSSELAGITPEEARVLTQELGIRAVYDLRNDSETASAPQPYLVGTQQIALAPSEDRPRKNVEKRLVAGVIGRYGAPGERMRSNYKRYVDDYPALSAALRSMASDRCPALIHCASGKDRTGVLAAILERLAGRNDDDIMANYLLANELNAESVAEEEARLSVGMTDEERAILRSFLEARPEYLQAFFDEIDERYGTFDAYVERALHLGPVQRESLQELMTR